MVPSGRSISTWPLRMTDHESSSSPSFMTTVCAFSTTANTMTAHSARRVASVMLAKACKRESHTWSLYVIRMLMPGREKVAHGVFMLMECLCLEERKSHMESLCYPDIQHGSVRRRVGGVEEILGSECAV